jgi:hypothetical protein
MGAGFSVLCVFLLWCVRGKFLKVKIMAFFGAYYAKVVGGRENG